MRAIANRVTVTFGHVSVNVQCCNFSQPVKIAYRIVGLYKYGSVDLDQYRS